MLTTTPSLISRGVAEGAHGLGTLEDADRRVLAHGLRGVGIVKVLQHELRVDGEVEVAQLGRAALGTSEADRLVPAAHDRGTVSGMHSCVHRVRGMRSSVHRQWHAQLL
jgi:hypothetical protein